MIENKPLPYSLDALEPVISAKTLEFHHGKHLKAYIDNLNKLIAGTEYESLELEEIILKAHAVLEDAAASKEAQAQARSIFNNAGQIFNHNLYFEQICSPDCHQDLSEDSHLYKQIIKQWGTLESFKEEFVAKGVSLFGSGWVYLSSDASGNLIITQETNASTPLTKGLKPLLTFDVWEHAYYLDYQNRRADYLNAQWNIINWKIVEQQYNF